MDNPPLVWADRGMRGLLPGVSRDYFPGKAPWANPLSLLMFCRFFYDDRLSSLPAIGSRLCPFLRARANLNALCFASYSAPSSHAELLFFPSKPELAVLVLFLEIAPILCYHSSPPPSTGDLGSVNHPGEAPLAPFCPLPFPSLIGRRPILPPEFALDCFFSRFSETHWLLPLHRS